jgi:SOS response regulatory protein OraA/RecX
MDEAFDVPVDWAVQAAAVYQKKYRGQAIVGDFDSRQRERGRRMRFLQHRGFDAEIIQRLINADDKGEGRQED